MAELKPKQLVQLRQHIDGVHWIYARVLQITDEGVLVRVDHAGNPEHDQQKIVSTDELRTKDDVAALLDLAMTTHQAKGVHHAIRSLREKDPWIDYAMTPDERSRIPGEQGLTKLHGNKPGIVVHYEAQLARLGGGK